MLATFFYKFLFPALRFYKLLLSNYLLLAYYSFLFYNKIIPHQGILGGVYKMKFSLDEVTLKTIQESTGAFFIKEEIRYS